MENETQISKKMLKNNEPSTEPCGTPKAISNQELQVLFIYKFYCSFSYLTNNHGLVLRMVS